jgi:hypothetical protein
MHKEPADKAASAIKFFEWGFAKGDRRHSAPAPAFSLRKKEPPALGRERTDGSECDKDGGMRGLQDLRLKERIKGFAMPAASAPNRVTKVSGSIGSRKLTTSLSPAPSMEHVGSLRDTRD